MKLLIIGGTRFLGRAFVDFALSRKHEVTLFNRGRTNKDLFDVEAIYGDRDGETSKLAGRKWDAVIDTCGYVPRVVRQSAETLKDSVGMYCFISTISVYREQQAPIKETDELLRFDKTPETEEITAESYGPFKVLCEETIEDIFPGKALHIRPGLIVGPHDTTDRLTYWVDRFQRRGAVLLPNRAQQPIQFIDVRDVAEFTIREIESSTTGIFNATGPAYDVNMGEVWSALKSECGGMPTEAIVSDDFLVENGVKEWQDLPFITPEGEMPIIDLTKSMKQGLTLRPLDHTIRDISDWHRSRGTVDLKAGMSREREAELLEKWSTVAPAP